MSGVLRTRDYRVARPHGFAGYASAERAVGCIHRRGDPWDRLGDGKRLGALHPVVPVLRELPLEGVDPDPAVRADGLAFGISRAGYDGPARLDADVQFSENSCVCGLRRSRRIAPAVTLSLTRKTLRPRVMSDS